MRSKILAVIVAAAALAGNAQSDEAEKFQAVVDGWSNGAWQEVSIVRRGEDGAWKSREAETYSIEKLNEYSLMFPPTASNDPAFNESAFSIEFSDQTLVTTFFDADGNIDSVDTSEIIWADIKDPTDWAFTVKWEEDDKSMVMSEGILTGNTYTWSTFRMILEDGSRSLLSRGIHIRADDSE